MNNDAILADIAKQLTAMGDFSQLQLNVKKHRGEFRRLETMRSTPQTFKNEAEPNAACASQILSLMKAITEARETGALSLTVMFNQGKAITMQVQDFKTI